MPKKGFLRYLALVANIKNFGEYLFSKSERSKRSLHFVTKPNALQFDVPESLYQVFKEIFMADVYSIKQLTQLLPAKPTIIDIGANAGFFDILVLSKLKNATIYAFEPIPSNVAMIKNVIASNQLETNILLHQKAVTGLPMAGIDLYIEDTDDNQVVASIFNGFNKSNTKKITIPSITLSEIINTINLPTIDLLKMDCEGSEYDIVYNTPIETITRIKHLEIEVHDVDKEKNNIYFFNKYLQKLGYKTSYAPINNFCYALQATM
jgi:FkbM family methyltransferase